MNKNIQILILSILMLININLSFAQNIGNEWINYSQKYYRIPIVEEGIYRITYSQLQSAGISISSIDPRQIQIFHNGTEQAIFVFGENDGIFHNTDYIEFYGKKNNAEADLPLFKNPQHLANKNYSFFNDTASYFLTIASGINNKRLSIETDNNFGAYSNLPYIIRTSRQDYTNVYFPGQPNIHGSTDFEYTEAEGWFDSPFAINPQTPNVPTTISKQIPTPNVFIAGPAAKVDLKVIGQSNFANVPINHHLIIQFPENLIDTLYSGYKTIHIQRNIPVIKLGNTNTQFSFTLPNDLSIAADRNTISYIEIIYPHTTNLNNSNKIAFNTPKFTAQKANLEVSNVNITATDSIIAYDFNNNKRIVFTKSGLTHKAVINNSGEENSIFLSTGSQINNVPIIEAVNKNSNPGFFTNFSLPQYTQSDYIIVTHSSLMSSANQYASYRNQSGYKTLIVDIDQLYDQFSYGIKKHPLGIRNFAKFAVNNFTDTIKGLFLLGKGFPAGEGANSYRRNSSIYQQTLVPPIGNPPSDIMFTSGINDSLYAPAIPTGRLSARNNAQVLAYLNKVIEHENPQNYTYNPSKALNNLWTKRVLHFAGGSTVSEGTILENYLNVYKNIISQPFFGGKVNTFRKNTTDPFQQIVSDSLKNLINNGVSILNFFGHAAGVGFDISIDNPAEYNNYQKYFFMLTNSCYSGDLFQQSQTSTEEFILIENKGAIGYLGSTTNALSGSLHQYSTTFINQISSNNYGNSIGSSVQNTIKIIQNSSSPYIKDISYTMSLHADPVIKLIGFAKPDFVITPEQISFNPQMITNEIDSFEVRVVLANIGRAVSDSFVVQLQRTYPDNSSEIFTKSISAPFFTDTISFTLAVQLDKGVGQNNITISLDIFNNIDELLVTNNTASKSFMITSSEVIPIYPIKFAVVPNENIKLIASTGNPIAAGMTYIFEIDTVDTFNSSFKQSQTISTEIGGLVEWNLPINLSILGDSTVYYWRTSIAGSSQWRESSFQYIQNKKGWGQAHFDQFKDNNFENIEYKKPQREFDFESGNVWISAQTGFYPNIIWSEEWIRINGVMVGQWSCTNYNGSGMKFIVIDPITAKPWTSYYVPGATLGTYQNIQCRNYDAHDLDYFTVLADSIQQLDWHLRMANLLNLVPNGHYVVAISHRNHNAEKYPEQLYQAFESIGSGAIRLLQNNLPYIIFGRKGDPAGSAYESIGVNQQSIVKNDFYIPTNFKSGSIESPLIGPAEKWYSAHWNVNSLENNINTDTNFLYILGLNSSGSYDTLVGPVSDRTDSLDILNLHELIDATQHEFIKLRISTKDDSLRTPTQLKNWQVLFQGVPETALSPNIHYSFYKNKVKEGEKIKLSISTKNISEYNFADSILVAYWLIDKNKQKTLLDIRRTDLHPSLHVLKDSIVFSTINMSGQNSLWVEINTINPATNKFDQNEQYRFNNIVEIPFFVEKDSINPLLDVTFDGMRILDGDIVSAKPMIQILLRDENQFLLLNDTSMFTIFLKRPNSDFERVYFIKNNIQQMYWYPATSASNNVFRIEFPAEFSIDGTYTLKVQAEDMSANQSGKNDYIINFKVINKSTITEVMNWPNPFSTRTHFVFTLTGSVIPDYFKIQIMTITGKVVREIDVSELGPINIGRNITKYAWDGKDQFGDQLANGVYLYRVITKINNQNIEKNETEASKYFTKEFGKMVLIR